MVSAENRYYSWRKALRKRRISEQVHHSYTPDTAFYNNLHQYSKNKIHCSCPMCSRKSRNKGKRKKHADGYKGIFNYKHSDRKRMDAMKQDKRDFYLNSTIPDSPGSIIPHIYQD